MFELRPCFCLPRMWIDPRIWRLLRKHSPTHRPRLASYPLVLRRLQTDFGTQALGRFATVQRIETQDLLALNARPT